MKNKIRSYPSRWWIVKLFMYVERYIPLSLLISPLFFALPLSIAGVYISQVTHTQIFTRGVIFGMIWLAIAPWLLTSAYRSVYNFFDENREKFLTDDDSYNGLKLAMLKDLGSPMYYLVAIPLVAVPVWGLLNTVYLESHSLIQIWAGVVFGLIFYFASMGFWGISRFNNIFEEICKQKIRFDPYNADNFGGLSFLGQFNIKGPQYFFTGSLLFPMAFETLNYLPDKDIISLAYWGVLLLYFALGISGFLIPQLSIKDLIAKYKDKSLSHSEETLQTLLTNLCIDKCDDKELAEVVKLKIDVYYKYFHERILAVKEWPFDWKIILQILASLATPLIVAILETILNLK
ncbi:hypothetical protein MASR2M66_02010 [Chloroflexota bacterium]